MSPPDNNLGLDTSMTNILKNPIVKKRGTNIEFELHSSYENYYEFFQKIANEEIKGKNMQFKKQDKDKYRFYWRYLSKGSKAALYLQATQNTAGLCFVSIDDHSKSRRIKEKFVLLPETTIRLRIVWRNINQWRVNYPRRTND